jgi:hypothetical protein
MSDTVTVYHPTIPKVTYDVPKGDVAKWVEQGWKKSEPKVSREADESE